MFDILLHRGWEGNAAGAGWLACDGGGDQTEAFFNPMLFGLAGGKLNKENVLRVSSYLPTKQAWREEEGERRCCG